MIDWLNNTNVILSIIVACITIGGTIIGLIARRRFRAARSPEDQAYDILLKDIKAGLGNNTALVVRANEKMLRGKIIVRKEPDGTLVELGPRYIGQRGIEGNLIYVAILLGLIPGNYIIRFVYPKSGLESKAFSAVVSMRPMQITQIDWRKGEMTSQ